MGADDRWQQGWRAWDRLTEWHTQQPPPAGGAPRDGSAALTALADVGVVRRLLDQAELAAVRAARGSGRPWAEIATELGVSRQAAWERWRDLDDPGVDALPQADVAFRAQRSTRRGRGRSTVAVPELVGMGVTEAHYRLQQAGLVGRGGTDDPTKPQRVTGQSPDAGVRVPRGSSVALWTDEEGGGAGVREPRRPRPTPTSLAEVREGRWASG